MNDLLLGAVAYDPKVVTIWDGFRVWLRGQGLPFDYVLYSNYERQVEELVAGRIQLAWNSPLAWVRASRLAQVAGVTLHPVTMRDTDCDLTSVIVVRSDSPVQTAGDLRGRVVRHVLELDNGATGLVVDELKPLPALGTIAAG